VVLLFGKNRFHIGFDMKTVFAEKQHRARGNCVLESEYRTFIKGMGLSRAIAPR